MIIIIIILLGCGDNTKNMQCISDWSRMKERFSIKEFSSMSGIEISTLRYWDSIGLFPPEERDPINNYRYYSPRQLVSVNFITILRGLNIPLKTIGFMKDFRNPENIMRLMESQEKRLDQQIKKLHTQYSLVRTRSTLIKQGETADESIISVVSMTGMPVVFGLPAEEGEAYDDPLMHYYRHARQLRVNLGYPVGGYYSNMEKFCEKSDKPDCFYSMDPNGSNRLDAGEYMVGFYRGNYAEFGDLPHRMHQYSEEHNWGFTGPVFTICLYDELCIKDSQYLIQVCAAVRKKHERTG